MIPTPFARITAAVVATWIAMVPASNAVGIGFPAQGDLAIEIVVDPTAARGPRLVRVPHFEALRMLVPQDGIVGVFDADGAPAARLDAKPGDAATRGFAVVASRDAPDMSELWFQSDSRGRVFLVWRSEHSAAKKAKAGASAAKRRPGGPERMAEPEADVPPGLDAALPVVTGAAGGVFRRSVWQADGDVIRQTSRAADAALVTSGSFSDFVVTVKVRPTGGRPARRIGLCLRAADRDRPGQGIRWLVGRADDAVRAEHVFQRLAAEPQAGPGIAEDGWTTFRARVATGRATFFIGDERVAEFPLPADLPAAGGIAIVTQAGEAEFTDLVVTDPAGGRLWSPHLAAGLTAADWHNPDHEARGGFFRVVPEDPRARLSCMVQAAFHRAPWRSETRLVVEPEAAAPWLFMPLLTETNPVTLKLVRPDGGGRIDFATAPVADAIFRSLPFGRDGLVCEASRAAFARPDDVRTDEEVSSETLAAVKAMTFKGRRPRRFLIGYPQGHRHDFEAGRVLGFNCLHGNGMPRALFEELGYEKAFAFTHVLSLPNLGRGYLADVNDAEMRKLADAWRQAGSLDRIHAISVFDEPGTDVTAWLRGEPQRMKDVAAFKSIIRFAGLEPTAFIDPDDPPAPGLTPDDEDFWKHVRTARLDERGRNPRFVLDTMRLQAGIFPSRFGLIREAIHRHFGSGVLVTANVHDRHFMKGLPTDIEPFRLYGRDGVLDVPQACDYNVGDGPAMEFMIDLFRSAQRPHDHPIDAYQASQSHYLPRPARSLRLRTMSAIAAGARSIQYYNYGPRYLATENWYDDDREKLQTIGEINHAVGWAEDALVDGRPRRARVAVLWPRDGDLWDQLDGLEFYGFERRFCHHLARGLGHGVDVLSDQHLPEPAEFDRTRVILMSQRCLPDEAARRILEWVDRGGTLVASVSCGQLDGLARPSMTMLDAFGIAGLDIEMANMHWTKLGLIPPRRIVDAQVETEGIKADVKPADATIVATFDDGRPALLRKARGRGQLIYSAFLLGWTLEKGEGTQASVRDLARPWLAPAGPPDCASDKPAVSARLIEGPKSSAVVLVNSTGRDSVESVAVTIARLAGTPLATAAPVSVESHAHGTLPFEATGDEIRFQVPLGLSDIVLVK